jgi:hypothetical protein
MATQAIVARAEHWSDTMASSIENAEKNTIQHSLTALKKMGIDAISRKQWLDIRQMAGREVDPDTAEVIWVYSDPLAYTESRTTGEPIREYFIRISGTDEWVRFWDLPAETQAEMIKKQTVR